MAIKKNLNRHLRTTFVPKMNSGAEHDCNEAPCTPSAAENATSAEATRNKFIETSDESDTLSDTTRFVQCRRGLVLARARAGLVLTL